MEIWPYEQVVYAQLRICPGESNAQSSQGFWGTNRSPNLSQMSRLSDIQQKKWSCRIVHFAIQADHKVRLKKQKER